MTRIRWYVPVLIIALAASTAVLPLRFGAAAPLAASSLSASYSAAGQPSSMLPGASATYTVTVTNTGSGTWRAGGPSAVRLSVRFTSQGGGFPASQPWIGEQRLALPGNVAPGGSATLSVTVTAPGSAGSYFIEYQLLQGSSTWFPQFLDGGVVVAFPPTVTPTPSNTPTATWTPTDTPTTAPTNTPTPTPTSTPASTSTPTFTPTATPTSTCPAPPASGTSYTYTSATGDFIGQGTCNSYSPSNATIALSGTLSSLTLRVTTTNENWSITLAAPAGENLHPNVYYNAERAPFRTGRSPGLDVSGDGRGCNNVYGTFAIDQISADGSGNVTSLDATFSQNCENASAPPLRGTVRYAMQPLTYSFVSDPGDFIGNGVTKGYTGSTTLFGMAPNSTASDLTFTVSGLRDTWRARLTAPSGQTLQAGTTYSGATRAGVGGSGPGLDVSENSRGCNTVSGTFTVNAIQTDGAGNVIALNATFEQHCEGATPALRGTIDFNA